MLTSNDFIIEEDDSGYAWVVILDGVNLGSFTSEEDAIRFVDYLVKLDATREEFKRRADELRKEFEKEQKRKSLSSSMG